MAIATSKSRRSSVQANARPVKTCIVVAGMHRSGTSATTRLLNLLGCDISPSLMPPDKFNEKGYWESPTITDLNDQILASAGLGWDDWQPLRAEWFSSPKCSEYQERAVDLLQEQFRQSHLFVIKDPRLCRTLPVWTKAAEICGIQSMVVSPIRAPSEVAKSLAHRNGMNGAIAQLLWLQYTLDAEFHSRNLVRCYLNYETLLSDWRVAARQMGSDLGLTWPRQSSTTEIEIDAFLNPSLRHHTGREKDPAVAPEFSFWVNRTFQLLEGLADGGDQASSRAELDNIRTDFEKAAANFARPLLEHQSHGRWLASRLEAMEAEVRLAQADLAALSSEREALRAKIEEQNRHLSDVQMERSASEAERRDIEAALAETRTLLDGKRHHVAAREDELAVLLTDKQMLQERFEAEHTALKAELAAQNTLLAEAQSGQSAFEVERNAIEDALSKLRAEQEALKAELAAQNASLAEAQSERSSLEDDRNNLEEALAKIEAEQSALKADLAAQGASLTEVLSERSALEGEKNDIKEALAKIEGERRALKAELAAQNAFLTEAQSGRSALEAEKKDIEEALAKIEAEQGALRSELAAQDISLTEAQSGRSALEAEKSATEEALAKIEGEHRALKAELAAQNAFLTEALSERSALEAKRISQEEMLARVETEQKMLREELETQSASLAEARSVQSTLKDEKNDTEAALAKIEALLEETILEASAKSESLTRELRLEREALSAAQKALAEERSAQLHVAADARKALDEVQAKSNRNEAIIQEYSKEIGSFREIIASKDFRIEQTNSELLEHKSRLEADRAERHKLIALAEGRAADVATSIRRTAELQSALDAQSKAASEQEAKAKFQEARYEAALAELNSVRRDIDRRNSELATYDLTVLEASERADHLEAELAKLQSLNDQLTEELRQAMSSLSLTKSEAEAVSNALGEKDSEIYRLISENGSLRKDLSEVGRSQSEQAEALVLARREADDAVASASSANALLSASKRETSRRELLWQEAARSLQLRNEEFDSAISYIRRLEGYKASIENIEGSSPRSQIALPENFYQKEHFGGVHDRWLPESEVVIDGRALSELMQQMEHLRSIEGSTTWRATRVLRSWVSHHEGAKSILRKVAAMLAKVMARRRSSTTNS